MSSPIAHVAHLALLGLVAVAGPGQDGAGLAGPTPRPAPAAGVTAPAPAGWGPVNDPVGSWPLRPRPEVVSGFDPPASPYGAGHRGVDLAGESGQEVTAAVGGRVTYAGSLAGRGVVVVTHGRSRTTYEPVDPAVGVGEVVAAGDVLGRLQAGGSHCLPAACLHWGLIEDETYRDPLTLVGDGPVRLLPWAR